MTPFAHRWQALVSAALAAGRTDEALTLLRDEATRLPANPDVLSAMGAIAMQVGNLAEAEAALRQCLALQPLHADARVNLAGLLLSTGRTSEALAALKAVHQQQPNHLGAWLVLARSRLILGDAMGAEQCLRRAESIQPDLPAHALFQLAGVLQERKAFSEAKPYYERAIAKDPGSFLYRGNYADMLCSIGELDRGLAEHRSVLVREPNRLRSHLALKLTLPGVHADHDSLVRARAQFAEGLEELHRSVDGFRARPAAEIESDIRWSNYLLAYQGEDDLALQLRFAEFQRTVLDGIAPRMPERRQVDSRARIRIGFASSFLYQCTVGWYFSSWIKDLDRSRFEPFIYSLGPVRDSLSDSLAVVGQFRQIHHLPLFSLAQTVLADELDVMVYPELGLCPTTFTLAGLRLAPLQCAGWGHPVTSGHSAIDLYFSSDLIEPEDGASHYSEQLCRLPGLGTRYQRPSEVAEVTRAELGLPAERPLALVSQSLFKIHPDNDELYRKLRSAGTDVHFLFFEDSFARNTELFASRLSAQGLTQSVDFTFLPRMSRARFLGVNRLADVMLDTLHWSGGNTSLDALSMGLPVVTVPGRFMRGRQSLGMLRALDCEGLAAGGADDYVQLAAGILGDAKIRSNWRSRILAGSAALYDQPGAPEAMQAALEAAVLRKRAEA